MGFLPRVQKVERSMILNPFRSDVAKWFSISANHCQLIEVIKVITDSPDIIGYGETMIDYIAVPFKVTDESIARVIGFEVSQFIFEDSIGAGLQMALLDATGKALGKPVHELLSAEFFRNSCPVSWWNMEAPAEVLATEAQRATAAGYISHKIKARPWFDIYEQVRALNKVTPNNYLIDIDWNSQLLDAKRAIPVIESLNSYEKIGLYEDPIPRDDVAGQKILLKHCSRPLLTHYFEEWSDNQFSQKAVNGYVIDGGVSRILRIGREVDSAGLDGFMQICGTGLTVSLSLHLGSVIRGAKYPYVSMTTAFTHDILTKPFKVIDGNIDVPSQPGLGVDVNENLIELLRYEGEYPLRLPRRIYQFNIGDGRSKRYSSVDQLWEDTSLRGAMPVQPLGSSLEILDDDGSVDFHREFAKLQLAPVWD